MSSCGWGRDSILIRPLPFADADKLFDAKVTVLGEYIRHHVKEEHNEIFPKLKKSKIDLKAIGRDLAERKEALLAEM